MSELPADRICFHIKEALRIADGHGATALAAYLALCADLAAENEYSVAATDEQLSNT
jgi:hypothetical protein